MIKFLKILKDYWVQITTIVALISAAAIFPFRLGHAENDIKDLREQTTAIYKWVEQEQKEKEYEKERIASAPPGYRWDSIKRQYVKL